MFEDVITFFLDTSLPNCNTSTLTQSNTTTGCTYTWPSVTNELDWYKPTNYFYSYTQTNPTFPPIRIIQDKDNKFIEIKMAIAGFKKEDITIETEDELLIVRGKIVDDLPENTHVIKNNLKAFEFEKKFIFSDSYFDFRNPKVSLENGMLKILINKNPELISEKKEIKIN